MMLSLATDWLLADSSPAMSALRWLLDVALQGTLLLASACLAALLLRRASGAQRHLVWLLALGGLLALPLLNAVVPHRQVLLRPQTAPQAAPIFPLREAARVGAGVVASSRSATDALPDTSLDSATAWLREMWPSCVLAVWLGGMFVVGARVALGVRGLRWLERESVLLLDGPLVEQAREAQHALRLERPVALRLARAGADGATADVKAANAAAASVAVPLTWGWRSPVVLLPAEAEAWPALRRRAVLLHELAHVARGDWATLLASQAACALFWFHPLAWLAARSLRAESERATDDRVLAAGVRAGDYGECLLEFVRLLSATQRRPMMKLAIAMARPSTLEGRLRALLDARRNRRGVTRLNVLLGAGLTAFVALGVATVRVTGQAQEPAPGATVSATALASPAVDLSSPEATVRSFIAAMESNDVVRAAACVAGANPQTAWLIDLQRKVKESDEKTGLPFDELKTSISGNDAVVNIVSDDNLTVMSLNGKVKGNGGKTAGRVKLHRANGEWKIVPLPSEKQRNDGDSLLLSIATYLAAPDLLSRGLRSDVAAVACFHNMSRLMTAMEWPGSGDRRLRLGGWKAKFLARLKEKVRAGANPQQFFHCPADKSGADSYSINEKFEGFDMKKGTAATSKTVFLYEGKNGKLDFRHHGHAMVMFYTAEVRFVSREEAKNLRWEP